VVPSSSNYIFSPASQIVKLGPDKTNVSFGATPAYSVSGKVTDASYLPYQPLAGVVVSAGGHSDISDSDGLYTIPLLTNGTYVVTGAKDQYQIAPASVQVSSKNVTNLNLSGNAIF